MRAAFDVSPKECVDLALRARSRAQKRFHWLLISSAGVLVFVVTSGGSGGSWPGYVVAAAIGLFAAGVAHLATGFLNRAQVRSAVKPLYQRHGRLLVEVEVRDDGVFFRQAGTDILIRWTEIRAAKLAKDGVEIWSPERMMGLVRDRGFASRAEMMTFFEEVNRHAGAL